jgi:excinuclease ABC subunit A
MDKIQNYYRQHSPITDPGVYTPQFDALPDDVPAIVEVVQGLIMHNLASRFYPLQLAPERRAEINLRAVPERLARIFDLNPAPLAAPRTLHERVVGTCRDFAVMCISMLRHRQIPARERVGFGPYFLDKISYDHRIVEYWDEGQGRWVLIDPQLDAIQRKAYRIRFDPLDMRFGQDFHASGDVWRRCRAREADPLLFGDSPTDLGMPPIRWALVQDLEVLNKRELLGWDDWGQLINKPENSLTETDLSLLDRMAELTVNVDTRFDEMQTFYAALPDSRLVADKMADLGLTQMNG